MNKAKRNRFETERKYDAMIQEAALLGVFNRRSLEKKYAVSHRAFTVMTNLKWIEKISAYTYKWTLLRITENTVIELLDNMNLMQDMYSKHKPAKKRVIEKYFETLYYMFTNNTVDRDHVMKEYKLHKSFFPVACEFNFIEKVSSNTYRYIAKGAPTMVMANRMYNYIVSKSTPKRIKTRPAKRIAQQKIIFPAAKVEVKQNHNVDQHTPAQPEKTNNTFAYLFVFLLGAVVTAVCWYAAQK